MALLKAAYKNLLEWSTVTLSVGTEDASYPLYRIYDRDIGKLFKTTAVAAASIKANQGAAGVSISDLFIPAGHGLSGATLQVKHSPDNITYTDVGIGSWAQGDTALIHKSWTPIVKQYWLLEVTAPTQIPALAELVLTAIYTWERNPSRPAGPQDNEFNVENVVTGSGRDRFFVRGSSKRQRVYSGRCGEAQKTNLLALNDAWAGSKPFWLCDLDGTWLFGKLRRPIELKEVAYQQYTYEFDFLEVLP